MTNYLDFINDPYFLKWIFQPDTLSEQYWGNYIENHPDEKKLILSIKEELSKLKLKNEDISDSEKKELLQSILKKKNQNLYAAKIRRISSKSLRYAAVAVVFLLIGNLVMYLYLNGGEGEIKYAELEYKLPVDKPTLILPDGSDIQLEKNSTVKYGNDREIIVDDQPVGVSSADPKESVTNQIIIPSGNRSVVTLSDNTVVHLNAGSRLIYPSVFTGKEREVLLFGEAFFEVSKNKDKPFIVKTSSLSVEVLGTKFNLSAYSEDNVVQTVLVEGEVAVKRNNAPFYEKSTILKPNQMAIFNKKMENVTVKTVDTEYYTLWKDGMLKFEGEDLNRVIKKIERFYSLTITFKDPLKGGVKVSGKLDLSENKDEVFEYLSTLTKMQFYGINENYYVIE